ncbi:pirin family protein [Aliikangiella sp. IMCC44359]|uniref:pirin family protein n=1 Tax=Aliikangiella sp. IMCC44359 TaxID=3459125 RepID=UPI00403AAEDA
MSAIREVENIINGVKVSDGDGVQLTRIIGSHHLNMLDPFLLFDYFGSNKPQDYIGGFPPHPHRGFETVTYMLAGKMRHQDNAGNTGVIETGGVQWMTAGKGIIHSEMPEQEKGLLAGFQLWINLPAKHKMTVPKYQEKTSAEIPQEIRKDKTLIKVIAGVTSQGTKGIIESQFVHPIYWDIQLSEQGVFTEQIPDEHNSFIYVIQGQISIGNKQIEVSSGQIAVLTQGNMISLATKQPTRILLIAGKPINEPVERAGPFVMNTRDEISQAFSDYQTGNFI